MNSDLQKSRRTASSAWLERTNPLEGLTIRGAQGIFDSARTTGSPLLQRVYAEIESADPVLMTCVERRAAALAGMGWSVSARADADPALAEEQRAAAVGLLSGIVNLGEAIEHLDLAFFRGYSHVQPIWLPDGSVREISLLESWNFLRGADGSWLWNPECSLSPDGLSDCSGARLVSLVLRRAIDYPALSIYIRHALSERDWGRFLERYGVPPVDAVMSPDATEDQRANYLDAAEKARDGNPVVWPAGSEISRAEGSRGQDPFSLFVRHQEELVVLMSTGGTLTSLAQAGSGTLAGGAQMDVWDQIVRRDAQLISEAVDRGLLRPYLEAAFPGRPAAASFAVGREAQPSAAELFDLAAKARAAGYLVDMAQLAEKSGYKLEKDAAAQQQPGNPAGTPLQLAGLPLQNAARGGEAETPAGDGAARPGANGAISKLLSAMAADLSPAGKAVAKLLALPDAEQPAAAAALAKALPDLIPEDPAMAAALEEELAASFAGELESKTETK